MSSKNIVSPYLHALRKPGAADTPHGQWTQPTHDGAARKPETVSRRLYAPTSTVMAILSRLAHPVPHANSDPMMRIKRDKLPLDEFKSARLSNGKGQERNPLLHNPQLEAVLPSQEMSCWKSVLLLDRLEVWAGRECRRQSWRRLAPSTLHACCRPNLRVSLRWRASSAQHSRRFLRVGNLA
jgi:hypothetical protein